MADLGLFATWRRRYFLWRAARIRAKRGDCLLAEWFESEAERMGRTATSPDCDWCGEPILADEVRVDDPGAGLFHERCWNERFKDLIEHAFRGQSE